MTLDAYGEELSGDLYDDARELDQKLNREINHVNDTIDTVNDLVDPTCEVLDKLGYLLNGLYALKPLVNTADSLAALADVDALLEASQDTLTHIAAFSDSAEDLLRRSGEQFDAATKQSLSSLAASLRSTADALGKNSGVRSAKDTIAGVVEDLWDEHTDEIDNLLLMDVDAPIESLTSARNPAPQSVQVLIRTQEIELAADKAPETPVAQAEKTTFLGRIAQMFRDFWAAITGLFR